MCCDRIMYHSAQAKPFLMSLTGDGLESHLLHISCENCSKTGSLIFKGNITDATRIPKNNIVASQQLTVALSKLSGLHQLPVSVTEVHPRAINTGTTQHCFTGWDTSWSQSAEYPQDTAVYNIKVAFSLPPKYLLVLLFSTTTKSCQTLNFKHKNVIFHLTKSSPGAVWSSSDEQGTFISPWPPPSSLKMMTNVLTILEGLLLSGCPAVLLCYSLPYVQKTVLMLCQHICLGFFCFFSPPAVDHFLSDTEFHNVLWQGAKLSSSCWDPVLQLQVLIFSCVP